MSVTSRNCIVRCRSLEEEYGLYTAKKDDIGIYNYQIEGNIGKLKSCLNGLLQEYGLTLTMKDEYIKEFCTYGAAEPCFLLGNILCIYKVAEGPGSPLGTYLLCRQPLVWSPVFADSLCFFSSFCDPAQVLVHC
ncbi:NEDD8-activating enzyme E1 regulatory subunit-like isoform X1 [Xenopus laevis]|uniref:NEDD8-activating enzyme E1 regulatory subunit-like isoform X1 n=1 Tax=Xenopus laevis TaxID=8355 RepID=A0A8J1MYL3_XENLA|nr:NEDD8-activating enzyme E1 regulatory subunit-like isoform X1 [Xenopus laevis]